MKSSRAIPADWRILRFGPETFRDAKWSLKQWNVLDGLKVNGAGAGYFEYAIDWPSDLMVEDVANVTLRMELSAKQLFGKDRDDKTPRDGDFMRGKGTHDPSSNPNAYPMTDDAEIPELGAHPSDGGRGRRASSCPMMRPTIAGFCRGTPSRVTGTCAKQARMGISWRQRFRSPPCSERSRRGNS